MNGGSSSPKSFGVLPALALLALTILLLSLAAILYFLFLILGVSNSTFLEAINGAPWKSFAFLVKT